MSDSFSDAIQVVDRPIVSTDSGPQAFWRAEEPVFDDSGQVSEGGMFQHQRDWWELKNFVKMLLGGYGSGKTLAGSKRIISSALQNAPIPVAAISPTFPLARRTTVSTIGELLEGKRRIFGSKFWWNYNASTHEFKIRFHGRTATIIIYSGDRPLALRGPNLAAAWLDEPFIMQYEVYEQMIARVRHKQAPVREIFMTGTPEQLNWGYDLCTGSIQGDHDLGLVVGSTRLNKAVADDYVKRLEDAYSEKAAAAYIDGGFVNLTEGLVYYGFSPSDNVVELDPFPGAIHSVGMDFNVNPMASCKGWYLPGRHLHIDHEYELANSDTEEMCGLLREKHGDVIEDICPDVSGKARHTNAPGGKSDYDYIREAGFSIDASSTNPMIRDRVNSVNGLLKARNGRIRLTVDPRCKKLIKYLSLYSHEQKKKQEAMSHMLDALGYLVYRKFPVGKDHFTIAAVRGA